jgi:hypothetical protein
VKELRDLEKIESGQFRQFMTYFLLTPVVASFILLSINLAFKGV